MRNILITVVMLFSIFTSFGQSEQIINSVKSKYAPDKRVALFEVSCDRQGDSLILKGKVDNVNAKSELINQFSNNNINIIDSIKVLPETDLWAFVRIPYAHLRTKPAHEAELTSQALMGTPLKVLEQVGSWYRVQTPDNYISWIINNSVQTCSKEEFDDWKSKKRYITIPVYSYLYTDKSCKEIVTDLVLGCILESVDDSNKKVIKLKTPDGRIGFAKVKEVKELNSWANQKYNSDLIIKIAKQLMGSTYTWGGTSTKGVDCSGLTKTCYFANGIILQRDASQQVLYGEKIEPQDWNKAKAGDLLYFGTNTGKVTHTAIYMGNGNYIHASGMVKVNSIDPNSKSYLTTPFISINRINTTIDTNGIVSVKNHDWYFKQ